MITTNSKNKQEKKNSMEGISISERKDKISWDYDADADILYIAFGNPRFAEGIDIGEGTIIRIDPETKEINGITILNPLHRTLTTLNGKPRMVRKRKNLPVSS